MTTEETISLIRALSEAGAISFKSAALEIHFGAAEKAVLQPISTAPMPQPLTSVFNNSNESTKTEVPHVEPEIVQKIKSVMQMTDAELLDAMIPEPPEPGDEPIEEFEI